MRIVSVREIASALESFSIVNCSFMSSFVSNAPSHSAIAFSNTFSSLSFVVESTDFESKNMFVFICFATSGLPTSKPTLLHTSRKACSPSSFVSILRIGFILSIHTLLYFEKSIEGFSIPFVSFTSANTSFSC